MKEEISIAVIQWIDSTFYRIENEFSNDIPEMLKPRTLISVGILINEDKNSITICQDSESTGEGNRLVLTIPKISILWSNIFTKKIRLK